VLDGHNEFSWQTKSPDANLSSFEVRIDDRTTSTVFEEKGITSSTFTYIDDKAVCGHQYCYTQRSMYSYSNGDKAQSISLEKCGVAFSTAPPDPITNVSISLNESQQASLDWLVPSTFTPVKYDIYRQNGSSFQLLGTTVPPLQTFFDANPTPACYQLSYDDICENKSPRNQTVCPITLTASLNDDNSVTLTWNDFNGWEDGVDYYLIEKYDQDGNLLDEITVPAGTTSYQDDVENFNEQTYVYVVIANPAPDLTLPVSISNRVTVIKNPNLFHPSAFTPNGDNLNDIFNVYGQYIDNFEMSIFNRWGELMFTTRELDEGWDGTYKGAAMPEGTYTFVANITDLAGRTFKKSGSILLLRKPKQ
jgi:gliding motility-associated-like protein